MKDVTTLLALLMFFMKAIIAQGVQIYPPYPQNYIVIEGESLTIPCVAGNANGFPSKITFRKKSPGGSVYKEMKANKSFNSITNSSYYDMGQHLFVTKLVLKIPHARYPEDGTPKGQSYECWSSHSGKIDKFTFTVYVIQKSSLPRAFVRATKTTAYGGSARLTCNVTKGGTKDAELKKVMWLKRASAISEGTATVPPIAIQKATTKDGGRYVCAATVLLKNEKTSHLELDSATLNIRLEMMSGATEIVANVSESVVMECPAEGYPLNVTWFRVNRKGQEVNLINVPRMRDRVAFSRPCYYCRYTVEIYNLEFHDGGHFVCKANTNNELERHHMRLLVALPPGMDVETTTTSKPFTTVPATKPESTSPPSKTNVVIVTVIIVLGLLLGLLLMLNVFLIYKLRLGHTKLQDMPDTPHEKSEKEDISVVLPGDQSPTIDFQQAAEATTGPSRDLTEGKLQIEKGVKEGETSEGWCNSQCSGVSKGSDQSNYEELPQNETTLQITITKKSNRRSTMERFTNCSLM